MRPTSIAPTSRDLSPVVQTRVLVVTPFTGREEAPDWSNPPKDPPVGKPAVQCLQKHYNY